MNDKLKQVDKHLDLDRTDKLFDIAVAKAGGESKKEFDTDSLRGWRIIGVMGNLHLGTAHLKTRIYNLIGYKNNLISQKRSIDNKMRKLRKSRRN